MSEPDRLREGDRPWSEAAAATLEARASDVRDRAKRARHHADADTVHDLRTSTRRLRTAMTVLGAEADKGDRKAVERELRRVARMLGEVRDLDVLLDTLDHAADADACAATRRAWHRERAKAAKRLERELERRRLRKALDRAARLGPGGAPDGPSGASVVHRVADRAPSLVWVAFGDLLAHQVDPRTADPAVIHEQRKAAKRLRYTLEVFEDALRPAARLIDEVTALQDAAGDMHDAVVARDRARAAIGDLHLRKPEAAAMAAFAEAHDRRADDQRPTVAREIATVRSRAFREDLARALAMMGHVDPAA